MILHDTNIFILEEAQESQEIQPQSKQQTGMGVFFIRAVKINLIDTRVNFVIYRYIHIFINFQSLVSLK